MARIRVTLDDEVLQAMDGKIGRRDRSRFLNDAAREQLERIELETRKRSGRVRAS